MQQKFNTHIKSTYDLRPSNVLVLSLKMTITLLVVKSAKKGKRINVIGEIWFILGGFSNSFINIFASISVSEI